ncbi:putative transcriptional regulatory protein [Escovopsis weberi]|uniref:Putative transcriptional regulatory protein n=1 Tax=Escovopsis weberi TaxID=150374 RepID=A0A0M9VWC5_ESCWE|nr:putative transcriptional regulatory protein [Escovopsis weberi]
MTEAGTSAASSHDEGSDVDVDYVDGEETMPARLLETADADNGAEGEKEGEGEERKKRKRSRYEKTSCELCKARKVKCDRAEPACSWCAQHNRACVYLERQRPGSRILLRSQLEAKVNRLEALLQSLGRRVEEHIASDHPHGHGHGIGGGGGGGVPAQGPSPAISNHVPSPVEPHHQDPGRPAAAMQLQLPLPPLSALGSVSSVGLAQAPYAAGAGFRGSYPSAGLPEPRRGPTPLSAINELPPHDIVFAIVDLYFKHCNPWCPILDRKTTFGTFFGSTSIHEPDRVLLHAIIATTLRFLRDPRMSPEMKAHQHAVSKQAVQKYTLENISVAALRALVILSLDELGASNGPKGWNMLSILAQNVTQLGLCDERGVYLAVDTDNSSSGSSVTRSFAASALRIAAAGGQPDSWTEDEGRRRLCWMVYLLDRYATIATTSLDFLLDDAKMRRALPCSYDLFSRDVPVETRSWVPAARPYGKAGYATNKPENLGSFSYHCEILRILSDVHGFLRAPVDASSAAAVAAWRASYRTLHAALDAWLASLPSDYSKISALCHSDPGSRVANWFMLHGAYVTAVVRLHAAAAYPPLRARLFAPSFHAMQRCLSAVQSLADITRDVFEASGLDSLGPPFVFALWVAARLLLVHAAAAGVPPDPQIDFFADILDHISQYWEIASHYSRILARAVQRSRQGHMTLAAMRSLDDVDEAVRPGADDDTAHLIQRPRQH